ncbi:pyridoxal phosphate-dependent transferase [Gamsiella multidivaricata]|uniref:pyridoxal phosphate-dependent transferase n=1 Tax=Gamsiella multidivaricata TaxID=101098 RepID=UPI0022207E67|nr:pyridoxal phosphate-dependent transferase [Gamsiella multidivaricata]KAG0362246.1 Threonine aldolase [Gamsiella multidivaricata]KAI7821511.1 pyridoxal phosphate-dependent transferase [Gamsiella multidivaricata]
MQKSSKSLNPLPYADFRSDTATAPTPDMFAAMMKSSLGDDVYNEDDSVKALERYVATLCGHEAALYCSSGTMTNQLAHRVHLSNPPQSAIVDIRSHVFNYEAGGISFHSQAAVYPIMPANGQYLTVEDIAPRLVFDVDVHYAPTRVISLENTLNGTIMPIEEIVRIRELTLEHGIKLHLDGARLWHASIATGISMREYCSHFDTISLCLSKGVGAPIGSILVGKEDTIKKARHFRLLFGGGWRQAGFLAEAALFCIKTNWPTMENTHRQARWLERAFRQVGCRITNPVDTNMVWVDTTDAGFGVDVLMAELAKEDIKISGSGFNARVVLHYQISDEVIGKFIDVLHKLASLPRMKVAVDLTRKSMREQPSGIYKSDDESPPSSPAPCALPSPKKLPLEDPENPRSKDSTDPEVATSPLPDKAVFEEKDLSSKKPHCFFEGEEQEKDSDGLVTPPTLPLGAIRRKDQWPLPNSFSSPSAFLKGADRPVSAYGALSSGGSLEEVGNAQKEQDESTVRRTQSLDIVETMRQQTAFDKGADKSLGAEAKKMNKLQYRLSHNPASKALKRASGRIVRWGSLLSRES